jgi:murein DD-endopeptidase MepM/ murein hydrolase activator NlpD
VDFIAPKGTPVLAAEEGVVTHIKDDSNIGGPDTSFWFYSNFITPKGTPVLAAADGVVTHIKDDSNIGGPDTSYWFYTNFITIKHSNGEYSRYDHLDYKSSKVKLNQKVHAGEEISKVGMTGYTYIPHLHFQVFIFTGYNIWTDFETIEIMNFKKMA